MLCEMNDADWSLHNCSTPDNIYINIYIYGWVGGPTTCWRVLSTDVELSILAVTCQHISAAGGFMLSAIIRPSRALFWHHDHHSLVSTVGLAGFPLRFSYLRCTFACEIWWISHAFHAGLCSFQCICPINLTFKTLLFILHLTSINIAISHYK